MLNTQMPNNILLIREIYHRLEYNPIYRIIMELSMQVVEGIVLDTTIAVGKSIVRIDAKD